MSVTINIVTELERLGTKVYYGSRITGTSTTAKIFNKSKISNAHVDEYYFNDAAGHLYKCTVGGKPSVAKWKYIRTLVCRPPKTTVTNLGAPVRTTVGSANHYMRATWKVPNAMTDSKKLDRASGLTVKWLLSVAGAKQDISLAKSLGTSATTSQINLNSFSVGNTAYNRASFWPYTSKKLVSVSAMVTGTNEVGDGAPAVATRAFVIPAKPVISAISFDGSTGHVSATVTTDPGTGYAERCDTRYKITVTDTRTGKTWVVSDYYSAATSIPLSFDVSDYQQLSYGQFVRVTFAAWSRGYAGNSDAVSRSFYVSYPAQTTIQGVDITSKDSTGRCVARIRTNSTTEHPVDVVKLEYLANCEYATESAIPGTATWDDAGIQDDAQCTALTMPVTELIPEAGNYTWIRVKSYHAYENVLRRYSNYVRLKALETPAQTATDESVKILSATAGDDGESVVVHLGWNASGTDDATGTELSWSESEDAWKSTDEPDTYGFTWSDGAVTEGGVTYRDSATITIKKLEDGTKYYIRARRYLDGDTTTYSPYSNAETCYTSTAPEAVTATCDRYVPYGQPLPVRWTFAGNSTQKEWQIVSTTGKVIASGKGSAGSARISADRLESVTVNNSVTFDVRVSSGSGFVSSENHTVTIVEPPALTITAPIQMTAQPYSFAATCSRVSDLIVVVTSSGAMGQYPDGVRMQTAGDTIYSERISPEWTEDEDEFTTTITIPTGLDFWDGVNYNMTVTAVDRTTNLRSDEMQATFDVNWAHKAVDPEDFVTVTPIDEVTEDGVRQLAVEIALTAPTGSTATDVYDIYRMDGGTARLIGQGFPLTQTTTDEYAPIGEGELLYYRIALRTVDGDVSFADIEYDLPVDTLRLDWRDGYVELPYNISVGDGYSKSVDIRQHMDGSVDGYWNPNISRKASLSTDAIPLVQSFEIEAVRQLARYAGAVFVRTPNGGAFEADVQITNLSASNKHIANIAIDATEIGLTSEFMLPTPFELEEGE